jgi:hypothetical protein
VGLGIPKVDQDPVAHVFRHETAEALNGLGYGLLIGRDDFAEVLRVHAGRECRRTHQIAEHHRDLAALGAFFGRSCEATGRSCRVGLGRFLACIGTESPDRIEELTAVSNNGDPEILEVLRRQIGQDRLVYLILAESRLILSEA